MKKIILLALVVILLNGCSQKNMEDIETVSFVKNNLENDVFKKSEVSCIFKTSQVISGKPNYSGTNKLYDTDPTKEGFEIKNYHYNTKSFLDGFKIKIIGLNSKTPKIMGNAGVEELITLNGNVGKSSTRLYLEKGPSQSDSISAYNISSNGSVIWVKTYEIVEPFSMIQVGYCE